MDEPTAATARKHSVGPSLRRLVWMTFWFCLASLALIRLPHEVSYWMLALAEKASLEGRTEEALAWVERAKPWTPESALPIQRQTQILLRDKKTDPIALLDTLLAQELDHKRKTDLHLLKSGIYHERKQYEDALKELDAAADYRGDLRPSTERLTLLLLLDRKDDAKRELAQIAANPTKPHLTAAQIDNELAYFSGLLGENLPEALERAERALRALPDDPAILDTRGYILHRLGRNEEANGDLQRAVEALEEAAKALQPGDPRAKNFAVMVYHRSLILEALGKSSEAEQDRKRVRELGFEPDERLF
jgi:tetratricopeptide (TPR) repeat protein